MMSEWYFKETLRNETKRFLISKLCVPWPVYIVSPSNSTHYYLTSSIYHSIRKLQRNSQLKGEIRRIYVCTPSLDKLLLLNSSALDSEHKFLFMIRIITGNWSSYGLLTLVISLWNNHRWAVCIENRNEDWPRECPFKKRGSVAVYRRSPRAHRKKRTSPDCQKIRGNCIETLEFSNFLHITILQ